MDNKYTELIKQWLETPSAQRDYSVGDFFYESLHRHLLILSREIKK